MAKISFRSISTKKDHIELQNPGAFAEYLKLSKNTICGRHPIAVWLHAIKENKETEKEYVEIAFVKYAQSNQVTSMHDSSVSYASAVARRTVVLPKLRN